MIVSEETLLRSKETREHVIRYLGLVKTIIEYNDVALASKDETISDKDKLIAENDKYIADLKSRLADKDNIIQLLKQRIIYLKWQIDSASKIANDGLTS